MVIDLILPEVGCQRTQFTMTLLKTLREGKTRGREGGREREGERERERGRGREGEGGREREGEGEGERRRGREKERERKRERGTRGEANSASIYWSDRIQWVHVHAHVGV